MGELRRKYHFTPELRDRLRGAYAAGNKRALSTSLDALEMATQWPRSAFLMEARRLGIITRDHRRGWTAEEDAHLAETVGSVSLKTIARHLGRSVESVEARAERIHLSRRVAEGYCASDLARCFGVHLRTVSTWMARGWLGKVHHNGGHRVTERNVARFIREYTAEYDLRRVDQVWFVAMVFGEEA